MRFFFDKIAITDCVSIQPGGSMKRKSIYQFILSVAMIFSILIFSVQPVYASKFSIVILSKSSAVMEVGDEFYLSSFAISEKEVTYKSSNSKVASINNDGLVKAKKAGTATISAKAGKAVAKCEIIVNPTVITLSEDSVNLYKNGTRLLKVTCSGKKADVTFRTSKKSVATVSEEGLITAMGHGTAVITVKCGGSSAKCIVDVMQPEVTLSTNEIKLKAGKSFKLSAFVSSGNAPEWTSSNTAVATVSKNGTVKAKSKGKTYVYAKEDGIKARCKVTVE